MKLSGVEMSTPRARLYGHQSCSLCNRLSKLFSPCAPPPFRTTWLRECQPWSCPGAQLPPLGQGLPSLDGLASRETGGLRLLQMELPWLSKGELRLKELGLSFPLHGPQASSPWRFPSSPVWPCRRCHRKQGLDLPATYISSPPFLSQWKSWFFFL